MMDIFSGTQNVILYCICRRGGIIAAGPTLWFINGAQVTRNSSDGDNPYSRNNVPAPLIIPSFTSTSDGTYGCRENTLGPPRATINLLAMSGMCNYNAKQKHPAYRYKKSARPIRSSIANRCDQKL